MAKSSAEIRKEQLEKEWDELNKRASKTYDRDELKGIWRQMSKVESQLKQVRKAILWEGVK